MLLAVALVTACTTTPHTSPYNTPRSQTGVSPYAVLLAPTAAAAAMGDPRSQYVLTRGAVSGVTQGYHRWLRNTFIGDRSRRGSSLNYPR